MQTFTLDFWLTISWYDTRLRFPEESIRDIRLLDINWFEEIWKPDIIFRNAREVKMFDQIVPNRALKMMRGQVVVLVSKYVSKNFFK